MWIQLTQQFTQRRQRGSVVMAVMAIAVLGFLLLISFSISQLRITHASQGLDDTLSLKLLMIAESGMHEAVATRLFPASNRYSFGFDSEAQARANSPAHPENRPKPFFYKSSYVYGNLFGGGTGELVGRYQYIVLGANPFFKFDGSNFDTDETLVKRGAFLYSIDTPVYVMSKGTVCLNAANEIVNNVIRSNNYDVQCTGGTIPRSRTVLAKLDPVGNVANPTANSFEVVSTKSVASQLNVPLETPIINRDGSTIDFINFDAWWANESPHDAPNGMAIPIAYRYATLDPVTQKVEDYRFALWPAGVTTIDFLGANYMPFLEVIFRGGIDERSLYVGNGRFRFDTSIEVNDPAPGYPDVEGAYSGVVLRNSATGNYGDGHVSLYTAYPGSSLLRVTGYTQCGDGNELIINDKGQLRDSEGLRNTQKYTIKFTKTCPPPSPFGFGWRNMP